MIYDRFQQVAINHINSGHSVIVSAPTGSGKTAIAEHVINDCLAKSQKVIYTAPLKALSNQKFRDFQKVYADQIGILTGDVSINAHAPVLIMTTEIFRNKVLAEAPSLAEYSWIIFDEVHYIDDFERGTVWEESLIFLPPHMKMLALSATIPNIDQFAEWIASIHKKPIKVVKEANRPVPLHFFYQCNGEVMDNIKDLKRSSFQVHEYFHRGKKYVHSKYAARPNRLKPLINHLIEKDRLPCIYFVFGRKRCELLADELIGFDFLDVTEKGDILLLFDDLCEKFNLSGEKSAETMRPLIKRGIAFHHAGMLPTLKEVIERLFTSRLIKVIFTTETFALGINMPARTVIFDELRKFYGFQFDDLKTRDFYQMAGRAGRRGIDTEGFVYSRVNPHYTSLDTLKRIIFGEPEIVRSRFNASYATLLNLYAEFGEGLYDLYPRSFHAFQEKQKAQKRAVQRMQSRIDVLKNYGYIKNGKLSEKGIFASKVYGYELPMSELHAEGILEGLSATELGIIAVALVHEPRKNAASPKLSRTARSLMNLTDGLMEGIHKNETKCGIKNISKTFYYHLAPAVEAWMRKEPFEKILEYTGADEGEIIRNFRMAVQVLREILDTPASAHLKKTVHEAIHLINRDIVDAETQLREM